jgi:hypothetical protein
LPSMAMTAAVGSPESESNPPQDWPRGLVLGTDQDQAARASRAVLVLRRIEAPQVRLWLTA